MTKESEQQDDGRRERKERRKKRFLPYLGKNRRDVKIVREADVIEIYVPSLMDESDRRSTTTRRTKPR